MKTFLGFLIGVIVVVLIVILIIAIPNNREDRLLDTEGGSGGVNIVL